LAALIADQVAMIDSRVFEVLRKQYPIWNLPSSSHKSGYHAQGDTLE